ncbi:hypothetical protein Nepgr_004017 [Nepenthes gracilis]|uniref:Uncharacterized protein n=1 Tax=Nepenthes gracilis TaxID=150966 RepID=A0AAD3S0P0_NEPGR|nr:hypothetical protein Nepgr_004017 [Nepenthes gracilis]
MSMKLQFRLLALKMLERIGAVEGSSVAHGFTAALMVADRVVLQQKLQNAVVSSGSSSINLPLAVYL